MGAPSRPSWRRKLLKIILPLLALLGIIALLWLRPKQVPTVKTALVQFGEITDRVTSSTAGDILPEDIATLRAQINASVAVIHKRVGDPVKKGELIVQLDDADLRAQMKQSEAALRIAKAQVSQSNARIKTLTFQADTVEALYEGKAATERERTDTKNSLREATTAKQVSAAQVGQSRAAKQVTEAAITKTQLRAPFDGVLADLPVHLGDGMIVGNPVFEVINDTHLYLEATLDEADAGKVEVGQEATLSLDALPNVEMKGHVARIDPIVKKDIKGARTLTIRVEIDNLPEAKSKGLRTGMSANVEVVVAKKEKVFFVPSSVIVGRGVNQFMYVLHQEKGDLYRLKRVPVTTGISNWEYTEIKATEKYTPTAGELVVASLNEKGLEDGVLVKVVKETGGK